MSSVERPVLLLNLHFKEVGTQHTGAAPTSHLGTLQLVQAKLVTFSTWALCSSFRLGVQQYLLGHSVAPSGWGCNRFHLGTLLLLLTRRV